LNFKFKILALSDQGYSPQSQQQFRNHPHQFYPADQQQVPSPHAERSPPAPLDSLQMLVKENGAAVNGSGGDKRPRHSDEAAGDSEGRKRRRKSDRPTRISNEGAQADAKADEPAAEPPPAAAEKPADEPAASSTAEEAGGASNTSTTEPEAQTAAASPPTAGVVLP
jgi:hypothetical protein